MEQFTDMSLSTLLRDEPLVMWPMLIASVVMLWYMLDRIWAIKKIGNINPGLAERVKQAIRQGQVKEAIALCGRNPGFITHTLEVALNAASFPREEMDSIFALYRMKLQTLLNKRLAFFATMAFIGPLVGLLGTVVGVIIAFRDLALSGSGGPTIVAAGISKALIATAAGISVAVAASVLYNFFTSLIRNVMQQYDQLTQEVAILVYTGSEKGHR